MVEALAHLPDAEWKPLATAAMPRLSTTPPADRFSPRGFAESILDQAGLQNPRALRPLLERLFFIAPYFDDMASTYAWRDSGAEAIPFLENQLAAGLGEVRDRAIDCLFEVREPAALKLAANAAHADGFNVAARLAGVGFEESGHGFRQLYEPKPLHIFFPADYVDRAPGPSIGLHPTWSCGAAVASGLRFGGIGRGRCAVCGERTHHLITLDPVPAESGVTSVQRLELETCRSCIGWSVPTLWFAHDREGRAQAAPASRKKPQLPADPFSEVEVALFFCGERWKWQDSLYSGDGNLNRVGGHPTWVQDAEYLSCPKCKETARFLLQIDSGLDGGWMWGDAGILYVFWCDRCRWSGQHWQCT